MEIFNIGTKRRCHRIANLFKNIKQESGISPIQTETDKPTTSDPQHPTTHSTESSARNKRSRRMASLSKADEYESAVKRARTEYLYSPIPPQASEVTESHSQRDIFTLDPQDAQLSSSIGQLMDQSFSSSSQLDRSSIDEEFWKQFVNLDEFA